MPLMTNLDAELQHAAMRTKSDEALEASLTREDMATFGQIGFVVAGWYAGWYALHQVAVFWMAGGF